MRSSPAQLALTLWLFVESVEAKKYCWYFEGGYPIYFMTSKHKVGWDPEWMKIPQFHWLVPVYDENNREDVIGMLCSTCRLHNQAQDNGEMLWSRDPVVSMRKDSVGRHFTSDQHKAAVRKEAARVAATNDGILQAFQREVSLQRSALITAMKCLYFLAKEEIAHTTKFSSLLDFAKIHMGCDVLAHLPQGANAQYRSERIMQELLQVMAGQIQIGHQALLGASTFFGLQCDETTDISTTKELVLLTRCRSYEDCCGTRCCVRAPSIQRLWYFWVLLMMGVLFCCGAGFFIRRRDETAFNVSFTRHPVTSPVSQQPGTMQGFGVNGMTGGDLGLPMAHPAFPAQPGSAHMLMNSYPPPPSYCNHPPPSYEQIFQNTDKK